VSLPDTPPPGPGALAIGLRVVALLAVLVTATWASHSVRDMLDMTLVPSNEQIIHRTIVFGTLAYVVLLALPFVPGAEIGFALLAAFGAGIAPLVYWATVVAMMLAYLAGRLIPIARLGRVLAVLRLRRAADLVARAAPLSREARLALLLEGTSPRLLKLALRNRYLALALLANVPGNVVIGGGGGIMMMAGLSGIFAPLPTFLAVAVAVCPIPLAVMLMGR
jgi:hypothetical protein